jgi:hypothetical protein
MSIVEAGVTVTLTFSSTRPRAMTPGSLCVWTGVSGWFNDPSAAVSRPLHAQLTQSGCPGAIFLISGLWVGLG